MRPLVHRRNHARSAELVARARHMLHAPTASEQRLWEGLRAACLPVAFKRQVVLCDRFIVDLVAPSIRLIVEIDGAVHRRRRAADARRDRVLERAGYTVLRFTAEKVLHELPSVVERIRTEVAKRA